MPYTCPECRRFLKNDLVEGLHTAPRPCPRCGTMLTAATFKLRPRDGDELPAEPDLALPPPDPGARLPDPTPLDPHPLEAWDRGSPVSPSVPDRDGGLPVPFPAAVGGAAAAGALLGALFVRRHRLVGAVTGALLVGGAAAAGVRVAGSR